MNIWLWDNGASGAQDALEQVIASLRLRMEYDTKWPIRMRQAELRAQLRQLEARGVIRDGVLRLDALPDDFWGIGENRFRECPAMRAGPFFWGTDVNECALDEEHGDARQASR